MARISHFATKADYELILQVITSEIEIKFVDAGYRTDSSFPAYSSPLDSPGFGTSILPASIGGMYFEILPKAIDFTWQYMSYRDAPEKYLPLGQMESVYFRPSGYCKCEYGEGLLVGEFNAELEDQFAKTIFNTIKKVIGKNFKKIKHLGSIYQIGPEAVVMLDSGIRLTSDLRQNTDQDITQPNPLNSSSSKPSEENYNFEQTVKILHKKNLLDDEFLTIPDKMPQVDNEKSCGISLFRMVLEEENLSRLEMPRTLIAKSELTNCDLSNTNLYNSSLCWSNYIDCSFAGCDLSKSDLRSSVFDHVDFSNANLSGADLRLSDFNNCDFSFANMKGVLLSKDSEKTLSLSKKQKSTISWSVTEGQEPIGG